MKTTYTVGLAVLTVMPLDTSESAILQRRGTYNHETLEAESWPGVSQVLVHGTCEHLPNDNTQWIKELCREITEELGVRHQYASTVWKNRDRLPVLLDKTVDEQRTRIYGVKIPNYWIAGFRLNASSGGIHILKKKDMGNVKALDATIRRETGVVLRHHTVMFREALEAQKKAFTTSLPELG